MNELIQTEIKVLKQCDN